MIERILQLRAQSVPIAKIARECGLTPGQVRYQLRKHQSSQAAKQTEPTRQDLSPTVSVPHDTPPNMEATKPSWQLPDFYGENRIKLMPQSPTVLHAYWEITWPRMRMVASYLHTDFRSLQKGLRLYDVTDRFFDGANAHGWRDIIVSDQARSWYITHVQPGRTYIADFGLFHDGRFCPILRSQPTATPRNCEAPWGDPLIEPAGDPSRPAWFENFSSYSVYSG